MINTIFYFADTENEYMDKYNKGEISSRTISFVKDSNKIFINGHDYIDRQSVIDQLVADSQQKDQALANLLRQELAAAEQELQSSISDANDYAEGVHNDLQGFKTEIAQDLTDSITAAITNANGRTIWTELSTTNEGLTAATNRINVALDADGNVKYTSALQSVINTGIDNNQAFTNIANRYAVLNDNQEIISWMTSGFKGHTDGKESFAAMYAAAQEATQNAIAQVQTDVTTDAAGKYVAKAGLATEVQNIVDEAVRTNSLSYVASKSDVSSAESRMGAQYTTLNNALGTTNTTLSEVKTTADEGKARASLLTSAGQSGGYIINETALESSMVSIFNKSGDASTFIQQKANAAKEGAEATAQTLINTAVSNAASTYATQASLNNVETTLSSYLKDSNGNVITSASLKESVDENSASITALANNLETGTAAGLVSKAGLDEAVNGLLAQNSNADTKATIQQIANTAAAETNIETRMKNALGVDALNKIAQKSYVDSGITTAKTDILSQVDTKTATAKAGAISEAKSYTDDEVGTVNEALNELSTSIADDIATVENKIVQESTINSKISTAKTEVLSEVDTKISNAKAGLATETYVTDGITSATADILSEVDTKISNAKSGLATETYVTEGITTAKADVLSLVDTKVSTATAGLATETYATTAATTAANDLKTEIWDSSAGKPKGIASLEQSVTTATNTADTAKSTADTAKSTADTAKSTADSATTAVNNLKAVVQGQDGNGGLTLSVASLTQTVSSNSTAITNLQTAIQDENGNPISSSSLLLSADLDSAIATLMANTNSDTGSKLAEIVVESNIDTSTITLSADQINFEGSSNFEGAVNALDITASELLIKDGDTTTAKFKKNGSWSLGNGAISWDNSGLSALPLRFSQSFLQAFTNALAFGKTEQMSDPSSIAGEDVVVSMPGTNVPPSITVQGLERQLVKTDGSKIYYYDQSTGATEDSPQYPYWIGATLAQKRNWLQNAAGGYKLTFSSGLLQKKQNLDVYSNKTINSLTALEIDARVDKIYKLTDSEVATHFEKNSSNYKGDRFVVNNGTASMLIVDTDEYFADVSNPTNSDWGILGLGVDPIESTYVLCLYVNGHWRASLVSTGAFYLYRHTNP